MRLAYERTGPSAGLVAALAAAALGMGVIAFVVIGGGGVDSSANVATPPTPPATHPAPPPPSKPTFTAADWLQARDLAGMGTAKSAEADAARERGDEPARKRLRAEALKLFERAIAIWQKIDALTEAEQNALNDQHGDTVRRWILAKRKLM